MHQPLACLRSSSKSICSFAGNFIVWSICKSFRICLVCFFPISRLFPGISKIVPGCHISWLDLNCLPVVFYCKICLLHVEICKAKRIVYLQRGVPNLMILRNKGNGIPRKRKPTTLFCVSAPFTCLSAIYTEQVAMIVIQELASLVTIA